MGWRLEREKDTNTDKSGKWIELRYLVYVPDSQGVILNNPIVPSANAQEPCADVEPTSGRWSDTHQEMSEAAVDQQNVN
uniref:Uncharacterized protein n=1 Tax=Caenorhabditis japonica TaxID=281687 RepID=A0A8R1EGE8_CAEJA